MNPAEFASIQSFHRLPVYDEGDPHTADLLRTSGARSTGELIAADGLPCTQWWLRQPGWQAQGAIRSTDGGQTRILVIFWKKGSERRRTRVLQTSGTVQLA
jgi:hypothetical protein